MSSLDGARRKLAAEGDGGERCPMHGYRGSNFFGTVERTPKARARLLKEEVGQSTAAE